MTNANLVKAIQQGIKYYDNNDYKSALPFIIKGTEVGNCGSIRRLAYMYLEGVGGLPRDKIRADELYFQAVEPCKLAASIGEADAQTNLGNMYRWGTGGLPRDNNKALELFKLAVENGSAYGQYQLAAFYLNNENNYQSKSEIFRLTRLAAKQGHIPAQNDVGLMYVNGRGVKKDIVKGIEFIRSAADQGLIEAQFNLEVMLRDGVLVKQNSAEAAYYFHLASEQGQKESQYNLGVMYSEGTGVSKNLAAAVRLYKLAADQGFAPAQNNLGILYAEANGVSKNLTEAVRLYNLSAHQELEIAQSNLGYSYENGLGVEQNEVMAIYWYLKSAEQGNTSSKARLCSFIRSDILSKLANLENKEMKMFIWQHMDVNPPFNQLELSKSRVIKMRECGMYTGNSGSDEFIIYQTFDGQEEGCKLVIRDFNYRGETDYLNFTLAKTITSLDDLELRDGIFENRKSVIVIDKTNGEELVILLDQMVGNIKLDNFIIGNRICDVDEL
jgi:TPR repeat protein